ncbi:SDR family oxidoreductase [Patulibacter sp.]|uniref:SDR family oxidoreductase n=1 Tax=Patulibacter sp. TaxID=1912859 RepID=UPI0027161B1B|nr:SDR family oxidoreductase [Patulibacter sp.]MDO9408868.1 SDR family oxidoreductase [Patulibacter sp.]
MSTTAQHTQRDAHDLRGRRVLVVGTGGIGREIAAAVVRSGGEAILAGRDAERAGAAAEPIGARSLALDVTDEDSVADGLHRVGPLDHLVSTAGAAAKGPLADLTVQDVERAVRAKLVGALLLAKHAAPLLAEDGSLTFFSGVVAWRPSAGMATMAMTNGGLAHLGPALAIELAPRRVNVVSPGIVDSGAWDGMGAERDAFLARTAAANPARRVGTPDDVARAVLAVATNPYITGSVVHVDGGGRYA